MAELPPVNPAMLGPVEPEQFRHRFFSKKLTGETRTVIYKVIQYFEEEKFYRKPKYAYDQVVKKTAEATGVSQRTISRIRQEGLQAEASSSSQIVTPKKKPRSKTVVMDTFELAALKQIITCFYTTRKEVPTLKKIYEQAREHVNYQGSISTLRNIVTGELGYRFKKCKEKRILLERPDIRAWRAQYLRAVNANEGLGALKKRVIYLGVAWMNDSPSRRWVLVHAGGQTGFIKEAGLLFQSKTKSTDCHEEMSGEISKKWITEQLIPNIEEPSIIVMNNAFNHSMKTEKLPALTAKKGVMEDWLRKNGVKFENNMFKSELYVLIKKNAPKRYQVEELFKSHGHEVLTLPPYNSELNPMEFILKLIKQRVSTDENKESNIETVIRKEVSSVTVDDWLRGIAYVKKTEILYWENEQLNDTQDFVAQVGANPDTSSDDGSANSEDDESMDDAEQD